MISPYNFFPLYIWPLFFICLFCAYKTYEYNNFQLLEKKNYNFLAYIIAFIIILYMGFRDIDGGYGDTLNYAKAYERVAADPQLELYEIFEQNKGEKLFALLMIFLSPFNDPTAFFLVTDLLYIGLTLWACKRIFPNNLLIAFLITITSFSFFSFGTNGIRNGIACAFILLAISYSNGNLKDKLFSLLLCLIAIGFHKSTLLPALTLAVSVFIIKNFKWSLAFWFLSIIISLLGLGNYFILLFENLGFDDRFSSYMEGANDIQMMQENFSKIGFRWDFLMYSSVPILIGYIVTIKNHIKHRFYNILLNTYTLANAFWVLVINASFSNRFAYLSWFMYPIVLSYPFLNLNVWNRQGLKTATLIILNVLFSILV